MLVDQSSLGVVAERILVQPYSMMINLERNLTPWNTQAPGIGVSFHLGTFNVILMSLCYVESLSRFRAQIFEL